MVKSYGARTEASAPTVTNSDGGSNNGALSIKGSVASLFFSEADLSLGKKLNLHFIKTTNDASILPRAEVKKLPFSLAMFWEIISHFHL